MKKGEKRVDGHTLHHHHCQVQCPCKKDTVKRDKRERVKCKTNSKVTRGTVYCSSEEVWQQVKFIMSWKIQHDITNDNVILANI